MNLVDQIFEQIKAGGANNQSGPGAEAFAQGMQMGQRQQSVDIAKQQLGMELAMAPLKQTLLQQDAQMNALKIEHGLKANQDAIEGDRAFAGLQSVVSDELANGGNYLSAQAKALDFALKNQAVFASDKWKPFSSQLENLTKEATTAEYQKGLVEARTMERDRYIREASRVGELTKQLRESQAKTLEPDDGNPEYRVELTKQEGIRAELGALQKNTASVIPELKIIGGKKFLVNPKTGAVHEISKTISKREFIANHVASWVRDNPESTLDEAAASMSAFYDQYLSEGTEASTTGTPSVTPANAYDYRYNPSSGRIEPFKP